MFEFALVVLGVYSKLIGVIAHKAINLSEHLDNSDYFLFFIHFWLFQADDHSIYVLEMFCYVILKVT